MYSNDQYDDYQKDYNMEEDSLKTETVQSLASFCHSFVWQYQFKGTKYWNILFHIFLINVANTTFLDRII